MALGISYVHTAPGWCSRPHRPRRNPRDQYLAMIIIGSEIADDSIDIVQEGSTLPSQLSRARPGCHLPPAPVKSPPMMKPLLSHSMAYTVPGVVETVLTLA